MIDQGLVLASADLARHAPELWRKFLSEFEAHLTYRSKKLIAAEPNEIMCAQGMAREASALLALFEKCVETARTLRDTKQG